MDDEQPQRKKSKVVSDFSPSLCDSIETPPPPIDPVVEEGVRENGAVSPDNSDHPESHEASDEEADEETLSESESVHENQLKDAEEM